jgi:hypothetical protein
MRKIRLLVVLSLASGMAHARVVIYPNAKGDSSVEPCTYTENFETRDLGAWASYPHWQDLAYDQNFRTNEMIPGDPNISLVEKVTPYSSVDNYAGAQKLLDMYLVPGSTVSFRYYLKTNQHASFYKIRFAAGKLGKIDLTLSDPGTNKWVWITASYDDFIRENPGLAGNDKIRVYALAFLACIPNADPAMPIYLGLDDITFKGARPTAFRFISPAMYKLPEFDTYIPKASYSIGDTFNLSGSWPSDVTRVSIALSAYTDTSKAKVIYESSLSKKAGRWLLRPLKLSYPEGLYIAHLTGYSNGAAPLYHTSFTVHIVPANLSGRHPRLLFDANRKKWLDQRLKEEPFRNIDTNILRSARTWREQLPVNSLVYDLDQFPDEDWLPTAAAWKSHFLITGEALWYNSLAYAFHGDTIAGQYAKNILLTLSGWPNWGHPWQIKRGRFSEHNTGTWSYRVAEAYDLVYSLMTAPERTEIRSAILKNIVQAVHRTYIYDNNVTGNTSNWLAATVGGSLMNMAAISGDGPETKDLEPYLTGSLMKFYNFITSVTDSKDGAWGEGLGYNTYSFHNMSQSLPALKNVFNIDLTKPLVGSYNEFIWAANLEKREFFNFGDSHLGLVPFTNWAFLLDMQKEPRLGWLYNYISHDNTFDDFLYDTKNIKQQDPFAENPDKIFHDLGTTVFKSGWGKEDLSFVMRTGAFYNHQHMDQGSFWFADHGVTFIGEREGSAYYDDALYQSWFIQPVSHSTILIDGNHQSQRIGDELKFAPGFDDHAFIDQSLDGKEAAFSSGDIGRLYWGKVNTLTRNVLFLKPRTILMLDVATPGTKDVDVTSLFQASTLSSIDAGKHISKITKGGFDLDIIHLAPERVEARAVETPHYFNTLINEKPLVREGMLTVTARTSGIPLVMANLLTSTTAGIAPDVTSEIKPGFVSGTASGKEFAFNTRPGSSYSVESMATDALAITWTGERIFAAMATTFSKNGRLLIACDAPATFELCSDSLRYDCDKPCKFTIGASARSGVHKDVIVEVAAGEGIIQFGHLN